MKLNPLSNRVVIKFLEAEEKLLKAIQKSDLEEVKIFEKEFLPSFHKTLDQMKK